MFVYTVDKDECRFGNDDDEEEEEKEKEAEGRLGIKSGPKDRGPGDKEPNFVNKVHTKYLWDH